MLNADFVKKVIAQDERNKFSPYNGDLKEIPEELRSFYRKYNPVAVELGYNGTSIQFIPVDRLEETQKDYKKIGISFVFATCDGDPIFYHDGKVFTCPHGVKKPEWELLAESFDAYLDIIIVD